MAYFPVEVKTYRAFVRKDSGSIELFGDVPVEGLGASPGQVIPNHLWAILFFDGQAVKDRWEARGRKLLMHRPQAMFSGILDLLRNDMPVFLDEDGTLRTSFEFTQEDAGKLEPA